MIKLNLPSFNYQLKKSGGKLYIFDVIRKKYVVLIPEEWVRQHFVHYLVDHLAYPKSLIKVEGGLLYNRLRKRSDIVVFNRSGQPWMIIECKSPEVQLSYASVFQASMYNASIKADYLVVTNGLQHYYAGINWAKGTSMPLAEMPPFEE